MKIDLINLENNSKANFLAVLLNITREFQRNYDEFITDKEKFDNFCNEKSDKFIYPDGQKYAVVIYLKHYLLCPEKSTFMKIINSI